MAESTSRNKKIQKRKSCSYAARKAENEIYYQMASIYRIINRDTNKLDQIVFKKPISSFSRKIYVEN